MSTTTTLEYVIAAVDKASPTFSKVGDSAGGMGSRVKSAVASLGFAAAGKEVLDFGKKAVSAAQTAVSETLKMQRTTGGSVGSVSALRGAFKLLGMESASTTTSLGKFARGLEGAKEGSAQAKVYTDLLGGSYRDAAGQILPMTELLPRLADKFATMPDGPSKTALALQLFGKQGAALIPFLNKGSAGIAQLEQKAQQMGLTMSGPAANSARTLTGKQRELDLSMQGIQQTLGLALTPAMADFATLIATNVAPGLSALVGFLRENGQAVGIVTGVLGGLALAYGAVSMVTTVATTLSAARALMLGGETVATGAGTAANIGFAASMWAATWPILAIIAVIALIAAGVWLIISNWGTIGPWLAGLWNSIASTASSVWDGITKWWGGVWAGIMGAAAGVWDGIKKIFEWTPLGMIIKNWKPIMGFFGSIGSAIAGAFRGAVRSAAQLWNSTVGSLAWTVPSWIPFIGGQRWSVPKMPVPALAAGGIVTRPTLALIGEAGPEAVVPLGRSVDSGSSRIIQLVVDGKVLAEAVEDADLRRRW